MEGEIVVRQAGSQPGTIWNLEGCEHYARGKRQINTTVAGLSAAGA